MPRTVGRPLFRFRVIARTSENASTSPLSSDVEAMELMDRSLAGLTLDAILLLWRVDMVGWNTMPATSRLVTPH